MKILFCIFSGTGNTLRIGEKLAQALSFRGAECEVYRIKEGESAPDVSLFDTIIFGYPVHAFNAPAAMLNFLKRLPACSGKNAYIIRTSGEPLKLNDASGITPRRILCRRGFQVLGEFGYVMPYNIIFKHPDKMAVRMWRCALGKIERDADEIINLSGSVKKINAFRRAVAFTLRIEHAAMPILGRTFGVNKKKCVGCGKCAEICPRLNIRIKDGKPKFGGSCVGCMACAFGCPQDAIRISVLNGWRVNGVYNFEGESATDEEICRYCRKSYIRYFHENESANVK